MDSVMHSCLQRVRAGSRLSCFIFSCKKMRMVRDSPELPRRSLCSCCVYSAYWEQRHSNSALSPVPAMGGVPYHLCLLTGRACIRCLWPMPPPLFNLFPTPQGNQLAPTIANDGGLPSRSLAEDAWADGYVVGDSLCSDHCCVSGSGERVRKRDRGQHG
jgi:hypothetical protein